MLAPRVMYDSSFVNYLQMFMHSVFMEFDVISAPCRGVYT